MLILIRKVQQGIWIEGDINIKVLSIERDRVKLGIIAPENVKVMRRELLANEEPPRQGIKPAQETVSEESPPNGPRHREFYIGTPQTPRGRYL